MMISSGVCGRAGTCHFFFPTMFIRQTGYQVSQCVYGKAGRGVQRGGDWPLSFIFPISFLASPSFSLIFLSFHFLALPIYTLLPSVVDVSWALTFSLFASHFTRCSSHHFIFNLSVIHRLQSSSSSSSPSTTLSYHHQHYHHHILSAKISWSDVETDEEMNKTNLVLACTQVRGPGKGSWGVGTRIGGVSSSSIG